MQFTKVRIVRRCRDTHDEVVGLAKIFVGTIHGFAFEILA
jgi:hypothetical protein